MSNILMISTTHRGRMHWFQQWSALNQQGIAQHQQARMTTTMKSGDVYYWKVLDPSFLGLEVDAIHFDDRCDGRMTPEQEGLYAQLKYRVRPK
jgi:hypothetical protein